MAGGTAGWTRQGAIGGQAACMHLACPGPALRITRTPLQFASGALDEHQDKQAGQGAVMHKWAVRELPDGCVQLLVWEVILRQRLASIVECGVYLSEEGTRFDTDLLHCREPAYECQLLPPGIRDGEWYPWIAFVNVVLDQDKSARRAQNPPHIAHDGLLIFMEMKGIGHDDAVEGRELESASEVASQR